MRWKIHGRIFDALERVIYSPTPHPIGSSEASVLEVLIKYYDKKRTDEQIRVEAWGEDNVSGSSLSKSIQKLRGALECSGKQLRSIIDTTPYRLIKKPEPLDDDQVKINSNTKTGPPVIDQLSDRASVNTEAQKSQSDLKPSASPRTAQPVEFSSKAPGPWARITFDIQRDLKPAILGMPLGPADAVACPRLDEVALLVSQIRSAYSVRLVGESGTGKSVCAYQVALEFTKLGWTVYRLLDSTSTQLELPSFARQGNTLLLIDDAHLLSEARLKRLEEEANSSTMLLSLHIESDSFAHSRGAISIDSKRAVNTIANAFIADLPNIGKLIRTIDDEIGDEAPNNTQIKRRVEDAREKAQSPWQLCFMLSSGARRARIAASSAKSAGTDIVLACAAINQIAFDDAPLNKSSITECLPPTHADADSVDKAISWLLAQRLLISSRDLRCPHLRFAQVLFENILRERDRHQHSLIGSICESVFGNVAYPFRGIAHLLLTIRTIGVVPGEWQDLVSPQSLMSLSERCWRAETPIDITWAARTLVEIERLIPDRFEPELRSHIPILASWISSPAEPSGWGLADLLEHLKGVHQEIFEETVLTSNPVALASAVSRATPDVTMSLGLLLIGLTEPDPTRSNEWIREWKESFVNALDRSRLMELGATWPSSECLFHYLWLCVAIDRCDNFLFLDLVEQSLSRIVHDFHESPFHALKDLEPCLIHIFGSADLLADLRPLLRGKRRGYHIVRRICGSIDAKSLAAYTSQIEREELPDLGIIISLLMSFANQTFLKICEAMDWRHIEDLIRDEWENLPEEVELLLMRGLGADTARHKVTDLIDRNMSRVGLFPPRFARVLPAQVSRHVEGGGEIRFRPQEVDDWYYWPSAILTLAKHRPTLVMDLVLKREKEIGLALSGSEYNWYDHTTWFILNLTNWDSDCLQRVLSHVQISTAASGWVASLKKGGGSRKAVSLLIEAAKDRSDEVGQFARKLRRQFPKSSLASWITSD